MGVRDGPEYAAIPIFKLAGFNRLQKWIDEIQTHAKFVFTQPDDRGDFSAGLIAPVLRKVRIPTGADIPRVSL
jgi:hypothetical protein